jgi:hypothetical protein
VSLLQKRDGAESDGNPPRLGSHPGVENKNDSVVRNMITAPALTLSLTNVAAQSKLQ